MTVEEISLLCEKCGHFLSNIVIHIMCSCDRLGDVREQLWESLISIDPIDFSVYLDSLTPELFIATMLSCDTEYDLDDTNRNYLTRICITYMQNFLG